MRPPPRWVRRLVLCPAVVVAAVLLVWTVPVALLAIWVASRVPVVGRAPKVLWFLAYYLVWEGAALIALFGTWVASGFGWKLHSPTFRRVHYRLAALFLRALFQQVRWNLSLEIRYSGDHIDDVARDRPLVVAARHAGPGDSFILVHALLNEFRRRPRIVLKDSLQWDPAVDVLMHRLPMVFITPTPFDASRRRGRARQTQTVHDTARAMGPDDALLVFPEGGNFSPRRRDARIQQLSDDGYAELADRAARMRNLMAPRPGGLFSAVDASPEAGVLFVGHTGLEHLTTAGDLWRALPTDMAIVTRAWYVPPEDIPADRAGRVTWLFDWWEHIDRWIADPEQAGDPSSPVRPDGGIGSAR